MEGGEVPEPVPVLPWLGAGLPGVCVETRGPWCVLLFLGAPASVGAAVDDPTAQTGQPGLEGAPWGETREPPLLSAFLYWAPSTPPARGWGRGHVGHAALSLWRLPVLPAVGRKGPCLAACGGPVGFCGAPFPAVASLPAAGSRRQCGCSGCRGGPWTLRGHLLRRSPSAAPPHAGPSAQLLPMPAAHRDPGGPDRRNGTDSEPSRGARLWAAVGCSRESRPRRGCGMCRRRPVADAGSAGSGGERMVLSWSV